MGPRQHRRLILLIYADYPRGQRGKKRMRRELAHSRLGDAGAASCPARITPSSVLAHRTSAPHVGPRAHLLRRHGLDVARNGPQQSDQRARHRHDRDLRALAIRQMLEPRVQPLLRLPRVREHRRCLSLLPAFEIDTDLRAVPIAPRRLHEHMAAVTIARLRNRAEALSRAARVLA